MISRTATRRFRSLTASVVTLAAVAVLVGLAIGLAGQGNSSAGKGASAGWSAVGGTYSNTRYSPLTQVNQANVTKLGLAWTLPQGHDLSSWEDYPVVVNGTMYLTTSADEVEALDAATGSVKWTFTPRVNFYEGVAGGGGGVPVNRGVAVADGKVYLMTFDDRLIALQQSTGRPVFQTSIADLGEGYSESASPTVYGDRVYVGSAEGDAGLRGYLAAYSATTGRALWRFYTVPAPGQGWVPARGDHGGGDVWMEPTIDPATNTLYFGTGNPSPDFLPKLRAGCDPYTDSLVALNATTGALKWAHQDICPDAWDYDSSPPAMYYELTVGGRTIEAVSHANKSGIYTVLNAATGQVISVSPHLTPYTEPHPFPTAAGVDLCPGVVGGIEYSPASFDPHTGSVYQDALSICMRYVAEPTQAVEAHKVGQIDFGTSTTLPANFPQAGYLVSLDPATGKVNWKDTLPKPSVGGTLSTAGGLVFTGDDDGRVYAADARTGKLLWSVDVGLAFGSAPMAYEIRGTEYIAVVAGGSSAVPALDNAPTGGELVVFKLGGSPVHAFQAANPLAGGLSAQALPNLGDYTKVSTYLYANAAQKKAVLQVVAAATTDNNGFNFDGYDKGKATFVVPAGWSVTLEFSDRSTIPHDVALTKSLTVPVTAAIPTGAFEPVAIPGPTTLARGLTSASGTVVTGFASNAPGRYYLVCGVPGHVQAGMWDYLTVSATAKQPAILISK